MGWPFAAFFGDQRKAEFEKEIKRIDAAIEAETSEEKKLELEKEKAELMIEFEKFNKD